MATMRMSTNTPAAWATKEKTASPRRTLPRRRIDGDIAVGSVVVMRAGVPSAGTLPDEGTPHRRTRCAGSAGSAASAGSGGDRVDRGLGLGDQRARQRGVVQAVGRLLALGQGVGDERLEE